MSNEGVKTISSLKVYEMPKKVIVIGNSCAGKTTFVNMYRSIFDIYDEIDDIKPLTEVFMLDDLIRKNDMNLENIDVKYCKDILKEYVLEKNHINFYTKLSEKGQGHVILRPVLWEKIVEYSLNACNSDKFIIQLARGKDESYDDMEKTNAYEKAFQIMDDKKKLGKDTIIVNLKADLKRRIDRNEQRKRNGGHYVDFNTMNTVYAHDIFQYDTDKGRDFYDMNGRKLLVYNIENNNILDENDLKVFMSNNIINMIKYYNKFKEDVSDGYEKITKRSLSK